MPEKYYQREAKEDDCTYLFDYEKGKWLKVCDVLPKDLPKSVLDGLKKDLEEAEQLKKIKL